MDAAKINYILPLSFNRFKIVKFLDLNALTEFKIV